MDAASAKQPEQAAPKKGLWTTILTTTPIVLTILATTFAGLSSSEMTQSMFYRSLAAQHQSKAGDQWAFFQAKRIRGTGLEATVDLLQSVTHPEPFSAAQLHAVTQQISSILQKAAKNNKPDSAWLDQASTAAAAVEKVRKEMDRLLADDLVKRGLPYLTGGDVPKFDVETLPNKEVQARIDALARAIGERQTESATVDPVASLSFADIDEAIRIAETNADRFDKACEPVADTIKQLRGVLAQLGAAVRPFRKMTASAADKNTNLAQVPPLYDGLDASFKTAALDFDARRYRKESALNRATAELYEIRVRRSGVESDRHRARSVKFFYCMLIAQLGVTVASLALARQQRSWLWLLAAVAGITALSFSGYVYLVP